MGQQHNWFGDLFESLTSAAEQVIENATLKIENVASLVPEDRAAHRAESLGQPVECVRDSKGRSHALLKHACADRADEGFVLEQDQVDVKNLGCFWAKILLNLMPV